VGQIKKQKRSGGSIKLNTSIWAGIKTKKEKKLKLKERRRKSR